MGGRVCRLSQMYVTILYYDLLADTFYKGPSRGHDYFIACSGWRRNFRIGHRVLQIPDDVNEDILALLMNDGTLSKECDTAPCSRVISPHIGGKLKYCRTFSIRKALNLLSDYLYLG